MARMPMQQRLAFRQRRQMLRLDQAAHRDRAQIGDGEIAARLERLGSRRIECDREPGGVPEQSQKDELARAAELHDTGKMAIPDAVWKQPGPLGERDLELVRQHTIVGERILNVAPPMRGVARLVRASHERFDGTGYPDGLAGEEIPLGARIIAVCDAFEAMIGDRCYRAPLGVGDALTELRRCAGSQFDPKVVEAFVAELQSSQFPRDIFSASPPTTPNEAAQDAPLPALGRS